MTRILLDPAELSGAASELRGAAGEYQAIGARVISCDCGCMPPAVAAAVDAATHSIRSRLDGLAVGLAEEGSGLGWRAGVPQDGAGVSSAVSSAYGGGDYVVVGGTTPAELGLGAASGGMTLMIGGYDTSVFPTSTSGSTFTIGGYSPFADANPFAGVMGPAGELIIGGEGYPGAPGGIGGAITVGGGNPFASVMGPAGELIIGGSDGVDYAGYSQATYEMNRALDQLLAQSYYTDPRAWSILMDSRLSQQRTLLNLSLPSGWTLERRGW